MSGASLSPGDLLLLHTVAARRAGVDPGVLSSTHLEEAAAWPQVEEAGIARFPTPFGRAAAQAEAAARVAPRAATLTALLALAARLAREGYVLVAPQGVLAGMVAGLVAGRLDAAALSRWIEDRAVPEATA
ncbi:MAG: hypothetical protein NVSMB29_10560 [Candidatus Dormibacteria bacterium]